MKKLVFGLLAISMVACQNKSAPPEKVAEVKTYEIEDFFKNVNVGGGNFSEDESKMLFHSDATGIFNVYEIDLASKEQTQITFSDKASNYAIGYVPNSNQMLFSADGEGDENYHIYLINDSNITIDITPFEGATSRFGGYTLDKKHMYFLSNKRDVKYFDNYKMSLETWDYEMVYENNDGRNIDEVSDNEEYITISQTITTSEDKFFLHNTNTKEEIEISTEPGSYSGSGFSKDNNHLYYTTDVGAEFSYLVDYNIETQERTTLFKTDWDINYSYLSENEKYRVIGINEDGQTNLIITDISTGEEMAFPKLDGNVNGVNISKSETKMRLSIGSSKSPNDIYLYNLETKELDQLTQSLNSDLNGDDLVSAEVVRYESFDGLKIPAIYYKPKNATADNPAAALVWVHGGPGGQSRQGYFEGIQYLVNHGYAVLAVNNRGSSGYGKTFHKMDNKNHGDKDLKDCIWGKKWLQSQDYVNPEQVGIIGGSYGGFMTMAAMTFEPEEFKVGVNLFGVTNWMRTTKSIPAYWESFRKALYNEIGDPYTEDSVRLKAISPLFHADKIKNPIMVLQGANDPRVLQAESDEIVAAARLNGATVEYVLFEDEGHGFRKKENQIESWREIKTFLDKYLKEI
jgi:dipeptidyl aminopeptidase/acylaminoacyl peptidase